MALSVVDAFLVLGGGLLLEVDVAEGVPPPAPVAVLASFTPLAFVDAADAVLLLFEDMLLFYSFTATAFALYDSPKTTLFIFTLTYGLGDNRSLSCYLFTFLLLSISL